MAMLPFMLVLVLDFWWLVMLLNVDVNLEAVADVSNYLMVAVAIHLLWQEATN